MRDGTFEEWYQWEMKKRDSKKNWHYPTKLTFNDKGEPIYKLRNSDTIENLKYFKN